MKYFIDSEFIEGFSKPILSKRRHFIDLISISIVAEDGREYSAISKEYNYNHADKWVKENVIIPLYLKTVPDGSKFTEMNFNKSYGISNAQIAKDIFSFVNPQINDGDYTAEIESGYFQALHNMQYLPADKKNRYARVRAQPEFYGYYCDYDWVLFCSLYGRMIDLPEGYPMYCRDVKQLVDEWVIRSIPSFVKHAGGRPVTFDEGLTALKRDPNYPQNDQEHNSIADARWIHELYKFITK